MASSRRVSRIFVIGILVAALAGAAWWFLKTRTVDQPKFQTAAAQRGTIVQSVTATGQLQPVLQTDVSSQISGRIVEVLVDYNTPVKKGDVLARIDPATFQSAVVQAENELLNARAQLTLAQATARRSEKLYEQRLIPDSELDQVRAQLEQADVNVRIREAALDSRKTDLSRCTIAAPIDGVVIDRVGEVGKMVAASLNAPTLFTIVNDLARMEINTSVAEADIGNVRMGQDVEFTVDAYPNERFTGSVSQIRNLPVTQQNVVVYATIIAVANERLKLKPGMTANVTIIVERHDNVLRVPNAALRARVPADLLAAAPAAAKPAGAPATPPADPREAFRALLRELGHDPAAGRPAPELMARARKLAAERGIEVPSFGGGDGGARSPGASAAATTRTVYRLRESGARPVVEAVTIKAGITDGSFTEVLDGIAENDQLVTSVTVPGAAAAPAAANPFGGGRRF